MVWEYIWVLELDGADGCPAKGMHSTLLHTLKRMRWSTLCFVYFIPQKVNVNEKAWSFSRLLLYTKSYS